jgi:hypothetical protein
MDWMKHFFYGVILACCFHLPAFCQTDSTMHISGEEVVVIKHLEKKLSGLSVGKIVFNPVSASRLPSLSGSADLLKLLELTPGVQNPGDSNTDIYIRGGDSGQNLLLYDDVPVYSPGHLLGFFSLFNSDHLSALELNKTGIPSRYGGRLSSVINVSPKKKAPEKTSIRGNVGLLASQATLELPLGDRFGLLVSGRKTYLEWLMQPLMKVTVNRKAKNKVEELKYDFQDANLTLTGNLSEKDRLTVNAFGGKDNFNMVDNDLLLNGRMDWQNTLFSVQWDRQMEENSFSQQLYWENYANNLTTDQAKMNINVLSEIQDAGYKNKYLFRLHAIPFETGIQYAFHRIQPQTYNGTPPVLTAHEVGWYGGTKFSIASGISADLGLRANVFISDKTFYSLEPRAVFSYQFRENSIFRLAYNRQNQYLNRLKPTSVGFPLDFWVTASSQLPPQSGNEFSAGYFKTFRNDGFEFSAEIFYRTMNHLNEYIQTITDRQTDTYSDHTFVGSGRAYGLEMILKKNYGSFTGWLSYTLGRSERTFEDLNQGKTFPARFDRRHDLSAVASYSFNEKWDASLVYVYSTGNAYTLPSSWYFIGNTPVKEYGDYNGARMPDYNRTDVSVNYWYKKDNGIIFSVYNVFGVNNPIYVFMNIKQDKESGNIEVDVKQKKLYTIIPAISWRFRF